MKKTFSLQIEGKHPDRVLDAIKHELNKYVKRERRKALPEGVDFWSFDCRLGHSEDSAESVHLKALSAQLDAVDREGAAEVYVEIWAKPAVRRYEERPIESAAADDALDN